MAQVEQEISDTHTNIKPGIGRRFAQAASLVRSCKSAFSYSFIVAGSSTVEGADFEFDRVRARSAPAARQLAAAATGELGRQDTGLMPRPASEGWQPRAYGTNVTTPHE